MLPGLPHPPGGNGPLLTTDAGNGSHASIPAPGKGAAC